jgi:hypothetical protein
VFTRIRYKPGWWSSDEARRVRDSARPYGGGGGVWLNHMEQLEVHQLLDDFVFNLMVDRVALMDEECSFLFLLEAKLGNVLEDPLEAIRVPIRVVPQVCELCLYEFLLTRDVVRSTRRRLAAAHTRSSRAARPPIVAEARCTASKSRHSLSAV